jgi:hypothetical protein
MPVRTSAIEFPEAGISDRNAAPFGHFQQRSKRLTEIGVSKKDYDSTNERQLFGGVDVGGVIASLKRHLRAGYPQLPSR